MIFATNDMVEHHSNIVRRFLRGWFTTVAYMRTHKAQTVRSIAPVLGESDAIVGELYDNDMPAMSSNGTWNPAAVDAVARSLKALGIMNTEPDARTLYTTKFVPVNV